MDRIQLPAIREGFEQFKPWRVAEQFSEAKDQEKGSEDGFIITEGCIAVLDGVSSRDTTKLDGLTPGQFAVRSGLDVIREAKSLDPHHLVEHLTSRLGDMLQHRKSHGVPSFVFVAFFLKKNLIVKVGDCSYLIDGEGDNPELAVDAARSVLRKRLLEKQIARGASIDEIAANDPARTRIAGLKAWQEHYSNNPHAKDFGYGVINGSLVPEDLIEYIRVPDTARSVILASDGYPARSLRMTLAETETALRKEQERDPLGIAAFNPSTRVLRPPLGQSATDDRTYIRLER